MIEALRARADALGPAAVGFTPAIDEVKKEYTWARSVVCAATSYLPPEFCTNEEDVSPRSLVARIARGADYHTVLREKLTELAKAVLEAHPAAQLQICVDTCRLPERKLAVLSGIAWRGKNGNVFVDGSGSWVALGEIVTDMPFEVSCEPQPERCGDCTRCIDACPTGAIVAPYTVDRSKCLSALTQSSGSIEIGQRRMMGVRIYGCDACQEVCPQNTRIAPITPEFARDEFPGAHPELIPLIRLTAEEFRTKVAQSSIGWIRRTRIRRNAAIAAGNLGCVSALPALQEMLGDENPILREVAEWAIGKITGRH